MTNPIPAVVDETAFICSNETATLNSGIFGNDYMCSNNETTESIVVSEAGTYSVTITNAFSCSAIKTCEVVEIETPIIDRILISQTKATIFLENEGNFVFSIDGVNFSQSNVFNLTKVRLYTAYVRGQKNDCGHTTLDFVLISIPSFFTPGSNGVKDFWLVRRVENFRNYGINVYDRFGKLIHSMSRGSIGWNGTWNGNKLSSTDYW